jgi:SAM-dependent methyltransferase
MLDMTARQTVNRSPNAPPPETCDLCCANESYLYAEETPDRLRTVVCANCGLIYAAPRPSPAEVDHFNLTNPGDKGSLVWSPSGFLDESDVGVQEGDVTWSSKIVERFVRVQGAQILSLRCLSGGLAASLEAKGAQVFGVDPFDANIRYARQVRNLTNAVVIPMSRFHNLDLPWTCQFDSIEGLTIHVLAHVMYPRLLLSRIYNLLKPGGYLFLDEKDVLLPREDVYDFVLNTGRAHQYHLTHHTTACYIRSAGFELIECQIDPERVSNFHHIRVVARKPEFQTAEAMPRPLWENQRGKDVLRQLQRLEWTFRLKALDTKSRQLLKRIPGLEPAWRAARRFLSH